jgi:hypothetical protein
MLCIRVGASLTEAQRRTAFSLNNTVVLRKSAFAQLVSGASKRLFDHG